MYFSRQILAAGLMMRYQDESHQVRNNTRFLYNPYYDLTVLKEVGKEI
jgi:hypothetical protein